MVAAQTPWQAVLEPSSGKKADAIAELHSTFAEDARCLGGYVFAWGNIVAPTATWFSLFDIAARPTELVDALQHVWTGKWPKNRAPHLTELLVDGQSFTKPQGKTFEAVVTAHDADGDALEYSWEIRVDPVGFPANGFGPMPALLSRQTTKTPRVTLTVPSRAGSYRLYATVLDTHGNVGVANAPLLVSTPQNPIPAIDKSSRFQLGDFYDGKADDAATLHAQASTSVWDLASQLENVRTEVAEGELAQRAITGDKGWLGLGVAYDKPIDVHGWTTLVVSLRSSQAPLEPLLSVIIADRAQVAAMKGATLLARDYGFRSDGKWHELKIPLADFQQQAAVDLTQLSLGFGLSAAPAAAGDSVDIDGLYLSAP
jgi:hypothetical protein